MCDVCLKSPCDARCPNAEPPTVVTRCANCGDDIIVGDEYYETPFGDYCKTCVGLMRKEAEVAGF